MVDGKGASEDAGGSPVGGGRGGYTLGYGFPSMPLTSTSTGGPGAITSRF